MWLKYVQSTIGDEKLSPLYSHTHITVNTYYYTNNRILRTG
jgi:hypothetical protein